MAKKSEIVETEIPPGMVAIRITKHGAGKVSTGNFVLGEGDRMAEQNDVLFVDPVTAKAVEAKGYGEIE
jgi:hypothetical protein